MLYGILEAIFVSVVAGLLGGGLVAVSIFAFALVRVWYRETFGPWTAYARVERCLSILATEGVYENVLAFFRTSKRWTWLLDEGSPADQYRFGLKSAGNDRHFHTSVEITMRPSSNTSHINAAFFATAQVFEKSFVDQYKKDLENDLLSELEQLAAHLRDCYDLPEIPTIEEV